ncbi:hypothetical protein ERO13_A02G049000v2 [Gossypium hirsutum]|nr:hypothetical protein ERO13_A02G049000v2 [Gossypium hirsutum]
MLSTMKNQKESLPLLLDLILTEKNSDDTNGSRLRYIEGQRGCRLSFWCNGAESRASACRGRTWRRGALGY